MKHLLLLSFAFFSTWIFGRTLDCQYLRTANERVIERDPFFLMPSRPAWTRKSRGSSYSASITEEGLAVWAIVDGQKQSAVVPAKSAFESAVELKSTFDFGNKKVTISCQ